MTRQLLECGTLALGGKATIVRNKQPVYLAVDCRRKVYNAEYYECYHSTGVCVCVCVCVILDFELSPCSECRV
jgi:hypothetical protein